MQDQFHGRRAVFVADRWIGPTVDKCPYRVRAPRVNCPVQGSAPSILFAFGSAPAASGTRSSLLARADPTLANRNFPMQPHAAV